MSQNGSESLVVGWRERVDLPQWGIRRIRAKIDTGARTSAIHVGEIQELDDGRVRFQIIRREKPKRRATWVEAEPVRTSRVKPSSGKRQQRIVVRTILQLGQIEREIELSLVCRKGMMCRMLIGRRALRPIAAEELHDGAVRSQSIRKAKAAPPGTRRIVVDPEKTYVLTGRVRRKKVGRVHGSRQV